LSQDGFANKKLHIVYIYSVIFLSEPGVTPNFFLNADQTKGRHPRTVYVSPKLQKELRAYIAATPKREPTAALFYTQKHPRRGFTPNTLTQHFLNMYRIAGIDGASSHSGRRTFATSLSSKGASIRVLMKLMGHRNISTTIGYVDASDDMLRRAVELV